MIELIWHIAEVIDIDETNAPTDEGKVYKLGRVQLKFIPGHSEIDVAKADQKALLPWARPFMHSFQTSFNPPKVGSKVWAVVIDEYYKNIFYLDNLVFNVDVPLDDMLKADFANFPSAEHKLTVSFPKFRFFKLPNDSIFFFDAETKELGIWHSAGTFVLFKANGSMVIRTNDEIDIKSAKAVLIEGTENVEITSGANVEITAATSIPIKAGQVYIGKLIADLADVLNQAISPGAIVSNGPAPMTPCLIPSSPPWITKLGLIKSNATKFGG